MAGLTSGRVGLALGVVAAAALGSIIALRSWPHINVALLQRQVSPGLLSAAHGSLETNCAACHTPLKSADSTKCVACHATNTALLERQSTAFHATVGSCSTCHIEHQGATIRPVTMDHLALANVGLERVRQNLANPSNRRLLTWIREHNSPVAANQTHPKVTAAEAALNCSACHGTKDRHQKLFGEDCASCHGTASWIIPEFVHPSAGSTDCAQCHRAPPSHYMEHFRMVSQAVARVTDARVDQCFRCHQTTSWNDIKKVGWYKHH